MFKCPVEAFAPQCALVFVFYIRQCFSNARIGRVDVTIDRLLFFVLKTVFFIPDVEGGVLH